MIVVDTHVIIWDALQPEKISRKARAEIKAANESDGIIFCDISLWEIAILIHKKRIRIETDYLTFTQLIKTSNKYIFQNITPEIANLSVELSSTITSDPANRIIVATALVKNVSLVTADRSLRNSKHIQTIW